jgi:hypothetical protein
MANQNETVPCKLSEEAAEQMQVYLELLGDRIEVLEWLDNYVYFFPEWQKTLNEALLDFMDKKQSLGLSGEDEKEMLTGMNFFLSKMAFFRELISTWHKELTGGKEETERVMRIKG